MIGKKAVFLAAACIAVFVTACLVCPEAYGAGDAKSIKLPEPQMGAGKPLMQVMKERRTGREFSEKEIPLQVLSNLLWAANGVNRTDSGKRTAPSAMNWQEIDIYVAMPTGLYLYDAGKHELEFVLGEDIRHMTGTQEFVKAAPVNLVYVADLKKIGDRPDDVKNFYSAVDTGFISQNVYLFCASEGLSTVVRGSIDRTAMAEAMKLGSEKKITLAQTVGYPK